MPPSLMACCFVAADAIVYADYFARSVMPCRHADATLTFITMPAACRRCCCRFADTRRHARYACLRYMLMMLPPLRLREDAC